MTAPGSPEAGREKPESVAGAKADPGLGRSADDADTGSRGAGPAGISLAAYCSQEQLSEAEIWRRLRRGELAGRKIGGQLMLYPPAAGFSAAPAAGFSGAVTGERQATERPAAGFSGAVTGEGQAAEGPAAGPTAEDRIGSTAASTLGSTAVAVTTGATPTVPGASATKLSAAEAAELADLPPLPGPGAGTPVALTVRAGASQEGGPYLSLSGERSSSPEMALLLDHLSLAKEENREILRMTQESLRKVSSMSDSIVRMKDALIAARDTEIAMLRAQLAAQEKEIRTLKQHSEDLEMLARTIGSMSSANSAGNLSSVGPAASTSNLPHG